MKHLTKKRAVLVAAVGAVALSAAAYAYFSSTGTGSGSASVGTSSPWQVDTSAATGGPLTPGGPSQTVAYSVKNTSTGNQGLAKVAVSVANADGSAWDGPGDCSAADFSVNGAAAGAAYDDTENAGNIGPGLDVDNTVSIQMVNDAARNQDDCKNVTDVPLYLSAS